jgi:Right handed beta helix region
LPLKFLAVTAAVVTIVGIGAARSPGATEAPGSRCDRVASPLGSNSNSGTAAKPYATVEKLAGSLRPGQVGCLRAGVYPRDVKVSRGGTVSAPTTITSFPGERATVVGRFRVSDEASNVIVRQLELDGLNDDVLPSPTVNGDNVVFRDNDVTNRNTTICFLLGSDEYGRARGTVIERNRIHNCGHLPPTNHHHAIYVEAADGTRITDNWIYDNADRGVQLFPDAQGTYVARNVIDGNGEGVLFSRDSANNVVERNVLSNPLVRYNLESFELTGSGNVARLNCLWSRRHWGNAGIQLDIGIPVPNNLVTDPGYVNRELKDFRLLPGSPCVHISPPPAAPGPAPVRARKRSVRPRLRANAGAVWPGGRLRLRVQASSTGAHVAASKQAVLKVRREGRWCRVGVMPLRGGSYDARVQLGRIVRKASRRFGHTRVKRGPRTLRLRAYVSGAGRSNIVLVRVHR